MDWKKEVESLQQGGRNWWKPVAGQHKIIFLNNGEEYETEWDGKTIHKVRFSVEISGNKLDWGVTKGITENSLYGQIALIGQNLGDLIGKQITVVAKGSGQDISYTVLEALPLMKPKEESISSSKNLEK